MEILKDIEYRKLTAENFSVTSLDGFQRRQEVFKCWRNIDGIYELVPVHYTEEWNLSELRELSERILKGISCGCLAYGAVLKGEVVGFSFLDCTPFGSKNQYVDLAEFYVSLPFRGKGVGKKLFTMACYGAKELGAAKLYISAHSAEESIAAYKKFGCVPAKEVNAYLAEKEPCDLQLEFDLNRI